MQDRTREELDQEKRARERFQKFVIHPETYPASLADVAHAELALWRAIAELRTRMHFLLAGVVTALGLALWG